jgi:hypothetical protein
MHALVLSAHRVDTYHCGGVTVLGSISIPPKQMARVIAAFAALAVVSAQPSRVNSTCDSNGNLYSQTVTLLDGSSLSLSKWSGNVTMVVNVASF